MHIGAGSGGQEGPGAGVATGGGGGHTFSVCPPGAPTKKNHAYDIFVFANILRLVIPTKFTFMYS